MKTCNSEQKQKNKMIWHPIILGFFMPYFTLIIAEVIYGSIINVLRFFGLKEIIPMIITGVFSMMPFALVSVLTALDLCNNIEIAKVKTHWRFRLFPFIAISLIVHFDVMRSSVLHLPGSSTSGFALAILPFVGILIILIFDRMAKSLRIEKNCDDSN